MPATLICAHCGKTVLRNVRLKKPQKYCGDDECQRARRRCWKNKQYNQNETYRIKCLEQQKRWRQGQPADQYQKNYRESHPGYVLRNRELQRQRNRSRREAPQTTIIKKDTLVFHPGEGGIWFLSQACGEMIVNRNALSTPFGSGGAFALMGVKEAKIVNRNALTASGP